MWSDVHWIKELRGNAAKLSVGWYWCHLEWLRASSGHFPPEFPALCQNICPLPFTFLPLLSTTLRHFFLFLNLPQKTILYKSVQLLQQLVNWVQTSRPICYLDAMQCLEGLWCFWKLDNSYKKGMSYNKYCIRVGFDKFVDFASCSSLKTWVQI